MTDPEIRSAIARSIELVSEAPESLRSRLAAVVLAHLLRESRGGPSTQAQHVVTPKRGTQPSQSILEALPNFPQHKQVDQVALIVAYGFRELGRDRTNLDEIRTTYRTLRLPKPGNLSEVLGRAIRASLLRPGPIVDGVPTYEPTRDAMDVLDKPTSPKKERA